MENTESTGNTETTSTPTNDPVRTELRKQLRDEIDGELITNPERFALEQKYGLADVTYIPGDFAIYAAIEEASGVNDGR